MSTDISDHFLISVKITHCMGPCCENYWLFTARCYAMRAYATASCLSVRLSVFDVEARWSHRLWYFENNLWLIRLGPSLSADSKIMSLHYSKGDGTSQNFSRNTSAVWKREKVALGVRITLYRAIKYICKVFASPTAIVHPVCPRLAR